MRILLVGSNGFIGANLYKALSVGHTCYGIDITDNINDFPRYQKLSAGPTAYKAIFSKSGFDVCINASGAASVFSSMEDPLHDAEANCFNVYRMLDAIREYNPVCVFIHISSAAVYGNPEYMPLDENADLSPVSVYGYNKMNSEAICRMYSSLFGIKICVLRPFSIYGTGQRKMLFWDLVRKFLLENEVLLGGTGHETRDFIHINDVVQCVDLVVNRCAEIGNFEVINIANGEETEVAEMADLVKQFLGSPKKIVYSGKERLGDPLRWRADISKLLGLGYRKSVALEEGVRDYVAWAQNEIVRA